MYVPASTLNGDQLIDIYSKEKDRLPSVFLSVIPNNNCTYFIMSCLNTDYLKIKSYFDEIVSLDETMLMRFLNWSLPTYSENIVLNPKLWNSWNSQAQKQFESIISGMGGDFEKILYHELPFESYEEMQTAINIQFGIIDMKTSPKYDLFC